MKKLRMLLLVVLTLAVALSCSVGFASEDAIKLGGMPADSSVAFFQECAKGMEAGAAAFGVEIDIQYTGRDLGKELSLTETYLSQGYDGLLMNCSDSSAVTGVLSKAQQAGVPMVCVDTVPDQTDLATSTVTSDNYSGGKAAGELMMELLPDGGDIIMTKLNFSSVAMDDRYNGFMDAIEGSNINIIDTVEQDGTREDTLQKITPMLQKYTDLVGVFCSQGDPAIGVLSAVNSAKLDEQITIISYDVESEVAAAIAEGSAIKGGVAQFPYAMAYLGVQQCLKAINGEEVENVIALPVLPVTQDNIESYQEDPIQFLEDVGGIALPTELQKQTINISRRPVLWRAAAYICNTEPQLLRRCGEADTKIARKIAGNNL